MFNWHFAQTNLEQFCRWENICFEEHMSCAGGGKWRNPPGLRHPQKNRKKTQQLQRFIATPEQTSNNFGGPPPCWWGYIISIDLVSSEPTIFGPTGSCLDSTNSIKFPDPIYFASLWGGWVFRFPHLDCLVNSSSSWASQAAWVSKCVQCVLKNCCHVFSEGDFRLRRLRRIRGICDDL